MRIVKTIIGILASLFASAHVVALINVIIDGSDVAKPFEASVYAAHGIGIAIGLLIAIVCFRGKKKSASPEVSGEVVQEQSGEGRLTF